MKARVLQALQEQNINELTEIFKTGEIDFKEKSYSGTTILGNYIIESIVPNIKIIKLFQEYGVDLNSYDGDLTYLGISLIFNRFKFTNIFLQLGADPNTFINNVHPIFVALKNNIDNDTFENFLKRGADPNAIDTLLGRNEYILYAATKATEVKKVQLLLEYGADPTLRSTAQQVTAYQLAHSMGHAELCEILKIAKKPRIIHSNSQFKNISEALFAGLKERNIERITKILSCIQQLGIQEKMLMSLNIDPPFNIKSIIESENQFGMTPLWWAATMGQILPVKLLLQLNADYNFQMKEDGLTTLMAVIMMMDSDLINHSNYLIIINLLIENGANLDAVDCRGRTCLHYAAIQRNTEVLSLLLRNKASEIADSEGKTPWMLAKQNGRLEAMSLLKPPASLDRNNLFTKQNKNNAPVITIPESFYCPITREVMEEPFIYTEDGRTYEKSAIKTSLTKYRRSPITNEELSNNKNIDDVLVLNFTLRETIIEFKEKYPDLFVEENNTESCGLKK